MKFLNLVVIIILSTNLFGCAFEENREVEKKLKQSVNNFHALFNQEEFYQIYLKTDDELKSKFTEQQFVSYLEVIKENNAEELKQIPSVWLEDNLRDGIRRILFKKTKFSNIEMVFTEKATFREKFEWNLGSGEPKLSAYVMEKVCDNPCRIVFDAK